MAQLLRKSTLLHVYLVTRYSSLVGVATASKKFTLRSIYNEEFTLSYNARKLQLTEFCHRYICTNNNLERLCWEGSYREVLLKKLKTALKNHQVNEAWYAYKDFKSLYSFPEHSLMCQLITELSYSSEPRWLQKAHDLVCLILNEKPDLLQPHLLTNLSLSFARAQMPVAASMILRFMLEKEILPAVNNLRPIILHMVNTDIGMSLASNILVEICECCLHSRAKTSIYGKRIKPDTMIFNLVLDACVRFGSSFKGQQIVELMAQLGVLADAHTINIIAQIHEINYQRDELKKFKDYIEKALVPSLCCYRQFYESLLNLHFKFNDIDSACGLIMDMCKYQKFIFSQEDRKRPQNPCLVPIGSHNLRAGVKLEILPQLVQKDSVLKVEGKQELVMYKNGRLVLSDKALAKLIIGFKRCRRIGELSKILITVQNNLISLQEELLCSGVFEACIHLGWLETAHDILEDSESAGAPLDSNSYTSLFKAYYKEKMFREAEALLKQVRKSNMSGKSNLADDMIVSTSLSPDETRPLTGKSTLANSLVREMSEEETWVPFVVNELNSSIYFFMKANMIDDAMKTYRKMQETKIRPTLSTFFSLAYGYSTVKMYREITILWGDIKRNMESGYLAVNRDLYELLLLNFVRGGYFERVMEVVGHMKEKGMYADKAMYKREFLKYHKDLYRRLKASDAKNEVQSNRIEFVQAFKMWVGIG